MSVHEFTGKTTEDAINEGLLQLGVTIADVRVEVLDEGAKGLFGLFGSKQARVRMTLQEDETQAMVDEWLHDKPKKEAPKAQPQKVAPQPKVEKPKPRQPEKAAQPPKAAPKPVEPKAEKPAPKPTAPVDLPTPELHDPSTPLGQAQHFLIQLTQLMNVPVAVEAHQDEEGNLQIAMTGDTLGILIGRRGDTLDALQYLTSLHVNKGREGYTRVTLDTENYRAKRAESLRRLATRMAARAVKTGRRVALEPMNPYERRILHSALQENDKVTTFSEGEEPNRHVVIALKDKEAK